MISRVRCGLFECGIGNCWMAVEDTEYTSEPFLVGDPEELLMTGQFNQVFV